MEREAEKARAEAECGGAGCDGRHIGLRVQCDKKGGIFSMSNQLGVCYDPRQVQKWKVGSGISRFKEISLV